MIEGGGLTSDGEHRGVDERDLIAPLADRSESCGLCGRMEVCLDEKVIVVTRGLPDERGLVDDEG